MSKGTREQKKMITMMFAKKTHVKSVRDRSDANAVARRRRIEQFEEDRRTAAEFTL